MKGIIIACALAVSACAATPSLTPEKRFEAYRAELDGRRAKGEITAVEEQEKLRDRYWQLFGRDAESAGHFAFCTTLMHSAEIGDFPMKEAQALISARESQLLAAKKMSRERPWTWDGDVMKKFDDMDR
jgi:hypothetical protein